MSLETILLTIIILDFIKSITIGSNFSFYKYFKYKNDYIKWYKFRLTYLPPHKRKKINKKKPNK